MFRNFCRKFLIVLIFLSLSLPAVFCFGADLELSYPKINNKTLTKIETPLTDYLAYIFDIGMFLGFLAVIFSLISAGVLYLFSPISPETKARAKDQIYGAVSGFLILITFYLISTTINPSLGFFKLKELPSAPQGQVSSIMPGVYFHKESGCPAKDGAVAHTANVNDFDESLKNQINSVNIIQDPPSKAFISILYDINGLKGACQYIDPNSNCHNIASFNANSSGVSSASVHRYDFNPNGDGVYFYREPFFKTEGGWFKVDNSQINNIYWNSLENISFTGSLGGNCNVPLTAQDCAKWEGKNCTERKCPKLTGKNIGSIKINGNYVVLLVYFDAKKDAPAGPWSFCQEFPTQKDTNKTGPNKVEWEVIGNQEMLPNYVAIFPVKEK
jgi:hypothetical protein